MHTPISRRAALKASGIAIALPLLESMNSVLGRESEAPPKRMVLICNALGLHSASLFPKTPGDKYENTEYLELLKDHRQDFTLFSGLSHPDQNGKEPHDTEMTWLSAARNPGLGGFKNSISVDQYASAKLGHVTRFPSISLSSNTQESQSYTSNGVMLPADNRPSAVFAKMFLDGSRQDRMRHRQRLKDGRSILDSVAGQTRALSRQTSTNDRRQLDEYFAANLGNANAHDPDNLPVILAGGGYAHGRYVAGDKSNNTPLCNLFVNLLNNMGIETEKFATSTGKLEFP